MHVEDVAEDLLSRLQRERAGSVVAVWADGRITTHGLGFYGFRRGDGSWSVPLASFAAHTGATRELILERLVAGLRRRGLMAAPE